MKLSIETHEGARLSTSVDSDGLRPIRTYGEVPGIELAIKASVEDLGQVTVKLTEAEVEALIEMLQRAIR